MSYIADSTSLAKSDPELAAAIAAEQERQENHLELIASENTTSLSVIEAQGSFLTNKYAEGYPGRRYYGGCQHVDVVERLAIDRARQLFGAEYANVQPHSGSQANLAVLLATCKPGDTVLGMGLPAGGHLSHGTKVNISGKFFNSVSYGLDPESEEIDYEQVAALAAEHKPRLIICGASAYSLHIDWQRFRDIADANEALVLADIAHYAGLVAAGVYPSPVGITQFVTSTTHKTLRGPRGGLIMAEEKYAKKLNSAVFPNLQGGPLMHVIAAKAAAFGEALQPEFKDYQKQVLANAEAMAEVLTAGGLRIVSGRTQSHMFLVDLTPKNVSGREVEEALDRAHITLNKNAIPDDPRPPAEASGIRIGTPALTTRGLGQEQAREVGKLILEVVDNLGDAGIEAQVAEKVKAICTRFPAYAGQNS
ncbi:MAG: serine hydroxymethyltransferase [Betaproteobacteria bacterium]|nr:serine hydroxymethyltransferase [Betaproteobacteria bacterium]